MEQPKCPFCEALMTRSEGGMGAYFRLFICPTCHAELKQVLVRKPEPKKMEAMVGGLSRACPECSMGEMHCFSCDDSICESHIRTFEKYAHYFSPELGERLIGQYGNRIYCPLCFQAIFKRFSLEVGRPATTRRRTFRLPVILGLLIVVLIIVLAAQRCSQTTPSFMPKESTVEFPSETG